MKKKFSIWWKIAIAFLALVLIMTPLFLTNPSEADYLSVIPTEFSELESKRSSTVHKDYGFISTYIITNQSSSNEAARIAYVGIAGQVINSEFVGVEGLEYENGFLIFISNCLVWFPSLLEGAKITILLTITSVIVGIIAGVFLALGKMSKLKAVRVLCEAYIFFFRGTPLLMQLFFIYYGLPLINPALSINDRFVAAWLAFSLNSAAYSAEIIRAGIQSIDKGQFEAAKVLGFSYAKTMRKIIIPQTYRRLIPPVANEFIMVLKDASLTSIIALQDLSKTTQSIMTSTSDVTVFIPSMILYLIITAVFTKVFAVLEKKFSIYE